MPIKLVIALVIAAAGCWPLLSAYQSHVATALSGSDSDHAYDHKLIPKLIEVRLSSGARLMVAQTEITVAQWSVCVAAGACDDLAMGKPPDHPVVDFSWRDAVRYIEWLARRTGQPLRVPSQREWLELAAEHGPKQRQVLFTDSRLAWAASYDLSAKPKNRRTKPVGSFGANRFGIYDLTGNVWEWTMDCHFLQPAGFKQSRTCVGGRVAMGERVVGLYERLRKPGNTGCGGAQPPANVGLRLVYNRQ